MVNDQNNRELIEALDRCGDRMARFCEMSEFGPRQSGNTATVAINAGGIGVWLAVTGCLMMFALNIALLVFFMRTDREVSEQGHQLNAIYILAPHLKPKETPK